MINNKTQNPNWSLFCKTKRLEEWRQRRGVYSTVQVKQRKKSKRGRRNARVESFRAWKLDTQLWRRPGSQTWGEGGVKAGQQGQERVSDKTRRGVQQANRNKGSTSKPSMEYKDGDDENIFTMEHINVDGISAREGMVEYQNVLGAFKHMEAGMFSVSEHTLDTS